MKKVKLKPSGWIRLAVTITVIAVSTVVAYRYPKVTEGIQKIFSAVSLPRSEPWTLKKVTVFRECRHQAVEHSIFASAKDVKDFLDRYPQWKTVENGRTKLEIRTEVQGFCAGCNQYRFIGVKSGKVVVMRGTPAKPGPVIQSIPMDVHLLPEAEREDLQRGIPFENEKEKLQLIEGLNGLIAD